MKILGFDTSQQACSVALQNGGRCEESHDIKPREQAQLILKKIDHLLADASLNLSDLDAIAFGRGPGSFTGVRIAVSVAQGLAYGAHLPLISVSSLQCLAQTAYEKYGMTEIIAAMDARMSEIYTGAFSLDDDKIMRCVGKESLLTPEALTVPFSTPWLAVGNAFSVYADQLSSLQPSHIDGGLLPHAAALVFLGGQAFKSGEFLRPEDALPVYLRDSIVST